MKREIHKLEDIRGRAEEISTFLEGVNTLEEFMDDMEKIRAVERNVEVIGEAGNTVLHLNPRINKHLIKNLREVISGITNRNTLAHEYNSVDHADLFRVAKNIVPQLERQCRSLVNKALGHEKGKTLTPTTKEKRRILSLKKTDPQENER